MKKIITVFLSISLTGMFICTGLLSLPVSAKEHTEKEFLAKLQDAIYCMYIHDEELSEEDIEWENKDADYKSIISEAENSKTIMDEMLSEYEKVEFEDERITLLKDLFFSGLHQMILADSSSDDSVFYLTQYTAGLMSYQIALNAFNDEYGIKITESDYESGNTLQKMVIDFWQSYLSEGVKEVELDGVTLLVPDYYVNMTDDSGDTLLLYASGENVAFVGFEVDSISVADFDELKEAISQASDEDLAEEFALGDDSAVTDIETLISDENTIIIKFKAEEETDVFNGLDVNNYAGYFIADRSSGKGIMEYLAYTGDEQLVDDFDAAILMSFTGPDTDAVSDQKQGDNQNSQVKSDNADGVTPELKEFLDAYEEVMNEYIDFMTNFDANDTSALLDYLTVVGKYVEFAEKAEEYESQDMSPADAAYYLEVTTRILKKMQSVGM